VLRPDVDVAKITKTSHIMAIEIMFPLLAEAKFKSPEWMAVGEIFVAAYFVPAPKLDTLEEIQRAEDGFRVLASQLS
jgi:hypothetical protein